MTKWWILIPNTNVVKRKYIKKAGNKFVYKPKLQSIREKPHYKPNALGSEVLSGSGRWRRRIWRISRRESWSWTKQATVNWLPRKSFASSLNLSLNPSSSIFLLNCAFHILLLLFFLICNQFQYPLLLSYFWFRFHPLGLLQLFSSFFRIVKRDIGEPRRGQRKQKKIFCL